MSLAADQQDPVSKPISFRHDLNNALSKALPSQMTIDVKVTADYPYVRVEVSHDTVDFLAMSSAECTLQSKETEDGIAVTFRRCKYKAGHFPFLDLPVEIRNMIYRVCLSRHQMTSLSITKSSESGKECSMVANLYQDVGRVGRILRINRLVYREALAVALSANSFQLTSLGQLRMFLDVIGSTGRILLTSLAFEWQEQGDSCIELEKSLLLLTQCQRLRDLTVTTSPKQLVSPDRKLTSTRCKSLLTSLPGLKHLTIEHSRRFPGVKAYEKALLQMLGSGGMLTVKTSSGEVVRTKVVS